VLVCTHVCACVRVYVNVCVCMCACVLLRVCEWRVCVGCASTNLQLNQALLNVASNMCMLPAIHAASRQGLRFEAGEVASTHTIHAQPRELV